MRLHVHEWGDPEAPALVCVHGVSAHGRRFRNLAEERLARDFRVLAPDLRGHGRSDYDPPWDIDTHLDDLRETVSAAGVESAAWIGHSLGGRLVLELASRTPERLGSAVLLDPAIQILPHVGFDFAQDAALDHSFATVDEAIDRALALQWKRDPGAAAAFRIALAGREPLSAADPALLAGLARVGESDLLAAAETIGRQVQAGGWDNARTLLDLAVLNVSARRPGQAAEILQGLLARENVRSASLLAEARCLLDEAKKASAP